MPEVISAADEYAVAKGSGSQQSSAEDSVQYTLLIMHLSTAAADLLTVLQIVDVRFPTALYNFLYNLYSNWCTSRVYL